jgi:hypothetical protein
VAAQGWQRANQVDVDVGGGGALVSLLARGERVCLGPAEASDDKASCRPHSGVVVGVQ